MIHVYAVGDFATEFQETVLFPVGSTNGYCQDKVQIKQWKKKGWENGSEEKKFPKRIVYVDVETKEYRYKQADNHPERLAEKPKGFDFVLCIEKETSTQGTDSHGLETVIACQKCEDVIFRTEEPYQCQRSEFQDDDAGEYGKNMPPAIFEKGSP